METGDTARGGADASAGTTHTRFAAAYTSWVPSCDHAGGPGLATRATSRSST
jgi:hypothetical protein